MKRKCLKSISGYKICGSCLENKPISDFYKKKNNIGSKCKVCVKIDNNNYRSLHKEELNLYRKNYYTVHKNELIEYAIEWRADPDNKKYVSEYKKSYLKENREEIYKRANKRKKIRRDTDPSYRLRCLISRSVSRMLKLNDSSKRGGSIKNALPFSMDELKNHLETQFESWMTWNNQGRYDSKNWNDNDSTTWTWQIDHVIPQADLLYASMQDDNFKKCWALENLRPLSAKQNLLDGTKRTRHIE